MKRFITLEELKIAFSYFKQVLLNTKQKFEPPYYVTVGERLLSEEVGITIFSVNKP